MIGGALDMDALQGSTEQRLTTADLAAREDFSLGEANVSPSTRKISGPGGSADVEPRVMQVLVVLADAVGRVVTRETLFERCWGGVYVGDDSLNRTIQAIRKLATDIASESFSVETVRRTGYRLTVTREAPVQVGESSREGTQGSRRLFIGGAGAAALAASTGLWWLGRRRADPRFGALMRRGEDALRLDEPAAKYFQQAVAIEPKNARAWGLLAYALASSGEGARVINGPTAQSAERAARTALEINAREPNALLTMTIVESATLDWFSREQEYRRLLAIDPDNTLVMRALRHVLHGAGRCKEALAIVERALAIEPLCPDHQFRKALQLWIHGRVPEADRMIDRAMELWPAHRLVRMGRLMIYAFTGRPRAALAMVEDEEKKPVFLSPAAASTWRTSLLALDTPTASTIAAARNANIEGSKATPAVAAWAIVALSALGEVDAAFEVANGFLLGHGPLVVYPKVDAKLPSVSNWAWRNTHGLWTPPTKRMRLDPRFRLLADGLGLTEFWKRRGIGPDAFLFKA
jgi:DNA-binding winged helix-turn-helix (wHTH) protein/tetratricopeptide (TPR) repeat protein